MSQSYWQQIVDEAKRDPAKLVSVLKGAQLEIAGANRDNPVALVYVQEIAAAILPAVVELLEMKDGNDPI